MKALIDTNVVLDILLAREPFVNSAAALLSKIEENEFEALITANSITDIVYIVRKQYTPSEIKATILELLSIVTVIGVDVNDIIKAFDLDFSDYEDALQVSCAEKISADYIITRNEKDFKKSNIEAISVEDFLAKI